ncbi:reverse transcriptase domain-containing protein [Tanacetum coccineum]
MRNTLQCFLDSPPRGRIQGVSQSKWTRMTRKNSLHTSQGTISYTKCLWPKECGRPTYQRLVDNAFEGQVGRNLEVYVDDLVIKSHTEDELVRDIVETFRALRKINMKLNPKKCTLWELQKHVPPILDRTERHQRVRKKQKLHPHHFTTHNERSPVIKWEVSRFEQVPIQVSRQVTPLVQNTQEVHEEGRLPLDYRSGRSLHAAQAAYSSTSHASRTPTRGGLSYTQGNEINYTQWSEADPGLVLPPKDCAATNNEAEYEALIAGLRIAARMGVRNLEANVDSRLVANHVLGEYVAKEDNMIQYLDKKPSHIQGFDRFTIRQVPRGDNKKADALSKIASTSFAHLSKQVLVEILKNKSIAEMEISTVIEEQDPTWMTPIIEFISKGTLPHEQKDARRIRRTAQRFELRNGVLYRRSFLQPWLRCVGPIQADYVLREIHAGSCSMHSGPRSVVARALRSGYYWPTMHRDARDMIQKCNDCQVHRPIPRQPQQELTPITSPWPFHKWGIDIAGPFPVAAGGLKFLIVAIDYFTKWIEARAVATITGNQVKRFVWDNIVCRFGLPGEIVSDNGKQFCDNPFKDWCARLSITQRFASVKHPQTNGLVERANRSLGEGIKARLDRHKGRWAEELSHVLWAHRTTIKVSTGDTPFSLVYGTEAVIPAEIGMPTIRTAEVNVATNDDERRIDLDILEERREQAAIREEKAKLQMKGYYDAKVRGVSFRPGDFVYRANDASHVEDTGKLGPKWEGPYEVTEALGKGAYKLRDMGGRELPRTWNICNLKKCYL